MLDVGLEGVHVLVTGANGGIGRSPFLTSRSIAIKLTARRVLCKGLPTVKLFLGEPAFDLILSR